MWFKELVPLCVPWLEAQALIRDSGLTCVEMASVEVWGVPEEGHRRQAASSSGVQRFYPSSPAFHQVIL